MKDWGKQKRATPFEIFCAVCGVRFEVSAFGGWYGREITCCGKECHDVWNVWYAKSLLGKPVEQTSMPEVSTEL